MQFYSSVHFILLQLEDLASLSLELQVGSLLALLPETDPLNRGRVISLWKAVQAGCRTPAEMKVLAATSSETLTQKSTTSASENFSGFVSQSDFDEKSASWLSIIKNNLAARFSRQHSQNQSVFVSTADFFADVALEYISSKGQVNVICQGCKRAYKLQFNDKKFPLFSGLTKHYTKAEDHVDLVRSSMYISTAQSYISSAQHRFELFISVYFQKFNSWLIL